MKLGRFQARVKLALPHHDGVRADAPAVVVQVEEARRVVVALVVQAQVAI